MPRKSFTLEVLYGMATLLAMFSWFLIMFAQPATLNDDDTSFMSRMEDTFLGRRVEAGGETGFFAWGNIPYTTAIGFLLFLGEVILFARSFVSVFNIFFIHARSPPGACTLFNLL